MRPFLFACVTAGLFGCTAMAAQDSPPPETAAPASRLRPSPQLDCDRNHLTSYSGVVSGYRRNPGSTWLEISTDEDTVEAVIVPHDGLGGATAHYWLWGAPFSASDSASIEASPGVLIKGMRAVAWVCDDGKTPPAIDWQPVRSNPG